MEPTVSVVIITLNEERNIEECIRSVTWADEIIIVDSFSNDNTVSISKRFTEKVVQRRWPGMVGPQRNVGLDMADSDWILFLDADERITDDLREEIKTLIRMDGADRMVGGFIPRKNYFFGRWIRSSYPDYTGRFVRKSAGRYNETPGLGFDTLVLPYGPVHKFRNPMIHLTGNTLAQRLRKLDFDSSLQADENYRAGRRVGVSKMLFRPAIAFLRVYLMKRGFLDGTRGFIYACLVSFNTFMKYAKLWEKYES
jgi:glycosyltransferase involved in cell wall biosynthesis